MAKTRRITRGVVNRPEMESKRLSPPPKVPSQRAPDVSCVMLMISWPFSGPGGWKKRCRPDSRSMRTSAPVMLAHKTRCGLSYTARMNASPKLFGFAGLRRSGMNDGLLLNTFGGIA